MPKRIYPTDLLAWLIRTRTEHWPRKVAFDTETSGLHPDAGARVSTVSVAWILDDDQVDEWKNKLGWEATPGGDQYMWDDGIWTLRREMCEGAMTGQLDGGDWAREHWVVSMAWPFDQGTVGTGKPEDPSDRLVAEGQRGLLEGLWTPDRPEPDTRNLNRDEWEALLAWLQQVGETGGLTAQNAKFDILMVEAGTRRWPGVGADLLELVDWDTMLGTDLWLSWQAARATGGTKPTSSLKPTARYLWGIAEGDEQQVIQTYLRKHKLPPGRWDLMPWRVIAKYADQDARLTARLRAWQEAEAARVARVSKKKTALEYGWAAGAGLDGFQRRMEVMRMLTRVERRGVPFATAAAVQASTEMEQRTEQAHQVLSDTLGGRVTLDMAKHYWFGHGDKQGDTKRPDGGLVDVRGLGLEPYARTKRGAAVVDISTLAKMQRDGVPLTDEWVKWKRLDDARNRWYDGWVNRAGIDGRLRTSFRQVGTASGRFSVEGLQLHSIPADYRVEGTLAGIPSPRDLIGMGVPEGYELWEMDLAQAELRVAAWMAGCERMLDAIRRGADLHGETTRELFGVTPDSPEWGELRQVAKRSNFSLIFGVGWLTFREMLWKEAQVDWDEPRVRELIRAWNALYPEFKQAIRLHDERALCRYREFGVGWMADGRGMGERRWFTPWDVRVPDERRGGYTESAHKAFNQRVQPALAQYGQDLWLGSEQRLRARYGDGEAGLCLMVHDSMVLLLPEGEGEQVCAELRDWGRELWDERFPGLPGDLDASRWSEHA